MMINYNRTVFVFLLLSLGIFKLGSCSANNVTVKCIKSEREALVRFKEGVGSPAKLSSWVGEECCQWKGVECDNDSGHVTKLNLSNPAGRPRHFDYYETTQRYPSDVLRTLTCRVNDALQIIVMIGGLPLHGCSGMLIHLFRGMSMHLFQGRLLVISAICRA
ncbi:hypothetical protein CMV_027893 [Castanea mollissima]|uniref:Leucine-rich repeat-containing N-terminal plant-type domain-containing protein n=1 Tax=Castanea mollissima TaxID=60419 RepID=A0A8J4VCP5_9ROSI|nr:hypothetical protein CMV_027893 [Castanea mollissima]